MRNSCTLLLQVFFELLGEFVFTSFFMLCAFFVHRFAWFQRDSSTFMLVVTRNFPVSFPSRNRNIGNSSTITRREFVGAMLTSLTSEVNSMRLVLASIMTCTKPSYRQPVSLALNLDLIFNLEDILFPGVA